MEILAKGWKFKKIAKKREFHAIDFFIFKDSNLDFK